MGRRRRASREYILSAADVDSCIVGPIVTGSHGIGQMGSCFDTVVSESLVEYIRYALVQKMDLVTEFGVGWYYIDGQDMIDLTLGFQPTYESRSNVSGGASYSDSAGRPTIQ